MYRRFFKFAVMTLTILAAYYISGLLSDKLLQYKWDTKPLRFVLISMGVITLIFYPLFSRLEEWLNNFSRKFVKAGHSFAGKYIGLLAMYVLGLLILLQLYANLWYDINIFKLILNGRFFSLF